MNNPELPSLESRRAITPDLVKPKKLAHLVFRTRQLSKMIDWYRTVLGAHIVFAADEITFLTYDDEHHRIALMGSNDWTDPAPPDSVGFYHVAFTYSGLEQLLQTYTRLKGIGILPYYPIVHGPTMSMYYRDPDGNAVELQIDVFETADEATAWMNGEAFRRNPIGVPFDPEDLIHRYEAGEPIARLTKRADT
ncbi:biphenyl 2,3-dioxygenase [Streptomyces cavourensis]|nr:biphenyl 2,3-dioxygenase [Streptomyces cavourensis]